MVVPAGLDADIRMSPSCARMICLQTEIKELQKAHFGMRMQKATQQLNNTSQLKVVKRSIARAKTILAQKQAAK